MCFVTGWDGTARKQREMQDFNEAVKIYEVEGEDSS